MKFVFIKVGNIKAKMLCLFSGQMQHRQECSAVALWAW